MCYLVTSLPPAKTGSLRTLASLEFEDETEARAYAEQVLLDHHEGVRLWKVIGQPVAVVKPEWR